jgi:hypothetical protein
VSISAGGPGVRRDDGLTSMTFAERIAFLTSEPLAPEVVLDRIDGPRRLDNRIVVS